MHLHIEFMELAAALRNEYLLKTEALFVAKRRQWFSEFAVHFQSICEKAVKMQGERVLPAISYLDYAMLYTNFVNRHFTLEVWAYGSEWYKDEGQLMVGEFDASFLFAYFDELWDKLLSARKRYVGKVTVQEVAALMMDALPDFCSYFTNIARFAIAGHAGKSPFAEIAKGETFQIGVGEYMAGTEPVYTESKNKDAAELASWFEKRLEGEYVAQDCTGLDFSDKEFQGTDFRYVQFCRSRFDHASLQGAELIGANFREARMEKCCLDNCFINEADFSYATLKGASFAGAQGRAGLPDAEKWQFVGFLPVSFRYADLTGASFKGADLAGAGFTGAVLNGADFTGAALDGTDFTGAALEDTDFTGAALDGAVFG